MPDPRLLAMIRRLQETVEDQHKEVVALLVEQDDQIEEIRERERQHGLVLDKHDDRIEDLARRVLRLEKKLDLADIARKKR